MWGVGVGVDADVYANVYACLYMDVGVGVRARPPSQHLARKHERLIRVFVCVRVCEYLKWLQL